MLTYLYKFASLLLKWLKKNLHYGTERFVYYLIAIVAFLLFFAAITSFIKITKEIAENDVNQFDSAIINYLTSFRTPSLNKFMIIITTLGERTTYIVLVVIFGITMFMRKRWQLALQSGLVLILAAASNLWLKHIINRARPIGEHLVEVSSLSYPSGHSMSAMAFYGFLAYLCFRYLKNPWIRYGSMSFCILLILGIGLSRIYLGVHYPSDVLGGFVAGLIWVNFCILLFNVIHLIRLRNLRAIKSETQA